MKRKRLLVVILSTSLVLSACSNETENIKSKPVSNISSTQIASSETTNSPQTISSSSMKVIASQEIPTFSELAGTYTGDNGKIYKINSDGTVEIDSIKYSLSSPNKSKKESTGEEFINYNLKESSSGHSGAYLEVYKNRKELAYLGPVKSTILKKNVSQENNKNLRVEKDRVISFKDIKNNVKFEEKDIAGRTFYIDGDTDEDLRISTMDPNAQEITIPGYSKPRMFINKNAGYTVYSYSKK